MPPEYVDRWTWMPYPAGMFGRPEPTDTVAAWQRVEDAGRVSGSAQLWRLHLMDERTAGGAVGVVSSIEPGTSGGYARPPEPQRVHPAGRR